MIGSNTMMRLQLLLAVCLHLDGTCTRWLRACNRSVFTCGSGNIYVVTPPPPHTHTHTSPTPFSQVCEQREEFDVLPVLSGG
jgi:hypothetical protein